MSAPPAIEAARRIVAEADHVRPHRKGLMRDYFDEAADVARAYLKTVEARDEVIEMCAKIADAEGLSPNASASYCAAAFHIGMCIRALKSVPPGEK